MSKSLGNGIDPIQIIHDYGADALRYFITTNSTPGLDTRYQEEKLQAAANYLNKIWNAARYILMNLPTDFKEESITLSSLNTLDRFILLKLEETIQNVTYNMEKYELANASTHLYHFVYDDFCSWYLEMSKVTLQGAEKEAIHHTQQVLYYCLKGILMMIYPYTPFFAEEIYQNMPNHKESIMLESYPTYQSTLVDPSAREVESLIQLIKDIRVYKVERQLPPNAPVHLTIYDKEQQYQAFLPYIQRFTFAKDVEFTAHPIEDQNATMFVYPHVEVALKDDVDVDDVLKRLEEEATFLQKEIERSEKMIANPTFLERAPARIVRAEFAKRDTNKEHLQAVLAKIASLKK